MKTKQAPLLVDGHVHFHDCYDKARFFDGASRNFAAAARKLAPKGAAGGCLAFTESAWAHHFRAFRDQPDSLAPPNWRFDQTAEDFSLWARHEDGTSLVLLGGRQLVTADGLEVLAVGTAAEFADGLGTAEAIAAVRESDALIVLPWGFGKWWFARGRIVAQIIDSIDREGFYLGDNGGRPNLSLRPRLFGYASGRGIRVLPGSDPLPFPDQAPTAGSFGFVLDTQVDPQRPGASIKAAIRAHEGAFEPFGGGGSLLSFCRQQVAMQIVKRRRDP
ncbi:MAG: hypothetical protein AAF637_21555 [Pseudomonadota bacterium]